MRYEVINITLNEVKIKLPTKVAKPLREKIKVRRILRKDPLMFQFM